MFAGMILPLHFKHLKPGLGLAGLAGMLAPWIAVGLFWLWLRSAWAAILAYHALILLLPGRRLRDVARGWNTGLILASVLPCLLAGPLTWLLLPSMVRTPVGEWLASFGLSGSALYLMAPYYGLVHPVLEQAHWGPLRARPGLALPASAMFAGYHGLVLSTVMEPTWIAVCIVVLFASSLAWTAMQRKTGGLMVPVLSHAAADAGMIVAALLLASDRF